MQTDCSTTAGSSGSRLLQQLARCAECLPGHRTRVQVVPGCGWIWIWMDVIVDEWAGARHAQRDWGGLGGGGES